MTPPLFISAGAEESFIDVKLSYRIIQLFSEGLYSSPNKAIEELVSNSFDAGANNVHVMLSADLDNPDATIVVVDDGTGMDPAGLRQHWVIGESVKRRSTETTAGKRAPIGKFGIGKLATYVLAERLTHICKTAEGYFGASMDFAAVQKAEDSQEQREQVVHIPLRKLSEVEAKAAVRQWTDTANAAYPNLFGLSAAATWTVAILSSLKEMAREILPGRLNWVLSTGMPLRDDFRLFLDGKRVESSKLKAKRIQTWVLGKDINSLPGQDDLDSNEDFAASDKAPERFGLIHPQLGRITGTAELFVDLLTTGKARERSHGFFVYVRGRLINVDDEYFGIKSNALWHGAFNRFRLVVNIDRLDEELRSHRESVRQTSTLALAQQVLRGIFNVARTTLADHDRAAQRGANAANRAADSPESLAREPLRKLVHETAHGRVQPKLLRLPPNLDSEAREGILRITDLRANSPDGLIQKITLSSALSQHDRIAMFDPLDGTLWINSLHPFVAHFVDDYSNVRRNLPLELLAISEVLLEARLYEVGVSAAHVEQTLDQRDELLRHLARSTGRRNAFMVAQDLLNSVTDKDRLEIELVEAFASMGFEAVPIGGSGKPDGIADAYLSASSTGERKAYRISLEAKSKQALGAKVSAKTVGVSAVARQRKDFECDHAVVVGPDFPTSSEEAAVVAEIRADREQTGNTITLLKVTDLARLVRLVPTKRIGLHQIRTLFESCMTPQDCKAWIDTIEKAEAVAPPYNAILETIAAEQKDAQNKAVEFGSLDTRLRLESKLNLKRDDLVDMCRALFRMAPDYVAVTSNSVEIRTKPQKIMDAIGSMIAMYPDRERANIPIGRPTKT